MADDVRVLDRLLEITVLLNKDMTHALGEIGLTTARTHLLWELHRLGQSTQQTLATALAVSARNVTGLVDALESTGFVSRRPHPSDRRATLVGLTELGVETMTRMRRERDQLAQQLVAGLGASEVERLAKGLDAVAARLRDLATAERGDQAAS